ncbi:MAG: spore coat associated protein CotJA [Firmicutes bacterium]|nr:spore coat associated protein CotJA [Clostridiales bacterium]MBQ9932149.1 spore coat associated protein CotJA [Bacillota bacterium]
MAYVPMQKFNTTFPPVKGLLSGTLFPELRKPFRGKRIAGGDGYAD